MRAERSSFNSIQISRIESGFAASKDLKANLDKRGSSVFSVQTQGCSTRNPHRGLQVFARLLWSTALVFVAVTRVLAQANFASLSGEVVDAQGAALPRATLTLKSPATGFLRKTFSNAEGLYDFTDLNPGDYQLQVEASGFQTQIRNVVLAVN